MRYSKRDVDPYLHERIIMGFWLAAFIMLFAAVELFNWIAQIGSWHASGVWLVLGGMGLAAISNWKPEEATDSTIDEAVEAQAVSGIGRKEENHLKSTDAKVTSSAGDRLEDSISFKIRPLKQ